MGIQLWSSSNFALWQVEVNAAGPELLSLFPLFFFFSLL